MNVLSLFDGISCARIALDNLGIAVDNYYAAEIDKYAIKVSKCNYPEIIHLGDIKKINASQLPKIDLLIGGSPCQDLSNAQNGLGLNGEKSGLFYEYIRLLKELKPKYFLLENVKNKWGNLMSEYVGVDYIEVNSNIFSAQSRPRLYWTNINYPTIPKFNSTATIGDILQKEVDEKYFIEKNGLQSFLTNVKISSNISKDGINKLFDIPKCIYNDNERQRRTYSLESKSPTILARADTTKILIGGRIRKLTPIECERLQCIPDDYTSISSDTQRYKMVGNGFTVKVIEHFLKGIKGFTPANKKVRKQKQLSLFDI